MNEKSEKLNSSKELAELCAAVASDRKAENVKILEMRELSVMADYFVLCTANSEPHLNAVANRIGKEVRDLLSQRPRSVEGKSGSGWVLMDYFSVIVHIMTAEMRDHYNLESLWGDAPEIEAIKTLQNICETQRQRAAVNE